MSKTYQKMLEVQFSYFHYWIRFITFPTRIPLLCCFSERKIDICVRSIYRISYSTKSLHSTPLQIHREGDKQTFTNLQGHLNLQTESPKGPFSKNKKSRIMLISEEGPIPGIAAIALHTKTNTKTNTLALTAKLSFKER